MMSTRTIGTLCLCAVLGAGAARVPRPASVAREAYAAAHSPAGVALVRAVSIPANPIGLALDAPARRVFVLSQGPLNPNNSGQLAGHASVSILDAATGRLLHTTALGAGSYVGDAEYGGNFPVAGISRKVGALLAVDERTGHVFVLQFSKPTFTTSNADSSPGSGRLRILDAATGRILRTVPAGMNAIGLTVDMGSGHLFIPSAFSSVPNGGARGGSVLMLSTTTGALVRTIPVTPTSYQGPPLVDARRGHILLLGTTRPGAGGERVVVIAAATGRVVRAIPLDPSSTTCGPSLAFDERANRFVAGVGQPRKSVGAQVLDGVTGRVLHDVPLEGGGRSYDIAGNCPLALAADAATGHAFVYLPPPYNAGSSYVSVLDTRSGRVLHTAATGFSEVSDVDLALDHRTGRAFVVDTNVLGPTVSLNTLTVLDMRSGRPLRVKLPRLGQGPPALAVDEQTGRLFVVNGADNTVSVLDVSHM